MDAVKKRRRHSERRARASGSSQKFIQRALGQQFINPIIRSAWGLRDCQFGREQCATKAATLIPVCALSPPSATVSPESAQIYMDSFLMASSRHSRPMHVLWEISRCGISFVINSGGCVSRYTICILVASVRYMHPHLDTKSNM
jgi:hypothetical protein